MISFEDLKDDFQKYLHSLNNLNIKKTSINETSHFHNSLKHKYDINVNFNNDVLTAVYKCSNDNDIFNRYGRFNNNIYQNSFFRNELLIEKNSVNSLYDFPKQFDNFYSFIKDFLNNNFETFNNNNTNYIISDNFFIIKKGNYIINKYNLEIKEDLFFYIHIDNLNNGKCKKYNLACPQLIGHEFFNYNNTLYVYNDKELTINDILINLFDVIRLIESLKRRKYEDYVLFLNFDDNDEDDFKIYFIDNYIKKILKTFKISLIK